MKYLVFRVLLTSEVPDTKAVVVVVVYLAIKSTIVKIDVDKNQALSQKLGIMSMPTLQIYKKGELVWQTMGVQTKQVLLNKLREAI